MKRNHQWPLAVDWTGFFTQDQEGGVTQRVSPELVMSRLQREGFHRWEDRALAEIYAADNTAGQSIPSGATWTKVTTFTTNGVSRNCTPQADSHQINATEGGVYRITLSASSYLNTANVTLTTSVFQDGDRVPKLTSSRLLTSAAQRSSTSISNFVEVGAEGSIFDVRVQHDHGSAIIITPVSVSLLIERVG